MRQSGEGLKYIGVFSTIEVARAERDRLCIEYGVFQGRFL
jgi:hypothetical protein